MAMTAFDTVTGRPLHGEVEAVETLTDPELQAELTIASLHPREQRFERLWRELLERRRGYHGRGFDHGLGQA
jgi:hypothetical protein